MSDVYIVDADEAEAYLSEKAFMELKFIANRFNEKRVASAINAAFISSGMKSKEFCAAYPCSKAFLSRIRKHGTKSSNVIKKAAYVFGISTTDLVNLGDKSEN